MVNINFFFVFFDVCVLRVNYIFMLLMLIVVCYGVLEVNYFFKKDFIVFVCVVFKGFNIMYYCIFGLEMFLDINGFWLWIIKLSFIYVLFGYCLDGECNLVFVDFSNWGLIKGFINWSLGYEEYLEGYVKGEFLIGCGCDYVLLYIFGVVRFEFCYFDFDL